MNWLDDIFTLTPVEQRGAMWFKRDDLFAPAGPGGINGSKLRQCIWLIARAAESGAKGIVSGTSVKSPQLMMTSAVARQFGLASHHVIGATRFPAAMKHVSVAVATWMGATWTTVPVAYNPVLQRKVTELLESPEFAGWARMEYGISMDHITHPPRDIEKFHQIGAMQVKNLPPHITTLVIPAGSCNTATSVLYGLARYPHPNLRRVALVGIGPDKTQWMAERLDLISIHTEFEIDHPYQSAGLFNRVPARRYEWIQIHTYPHLYSYQDEQPFSYNGLVFHPTYEGKCMKVLTELHPELVAEDTCFWVVGGPVDIEVMRKAAA